MLSKSQARLFFITGTLLCAGSFGLLTLDSHRRIPEQTHEVNMTEAVTRGKHLWDRNNCMGCHDLLGEGAYYAPELTKVYERRGPEWIRVFLKDPEAMFPGERKMVNYHFTDDEISDLIAFFKWIGEMDLNGFPPKPSFGSPKPATESVQAPAASTAGAAPATFTSLCLSCHAVGGKGGNVGPALDGVGVKFEADYLRRWLADPASIKPGTAMPKLPLTATDRDAIVDYLTSLKGK